jgi:hypothetical protein
MKLAESNGIYSIGRVRITDPDNPILGMLLEPGLNHHFDRHELSIYTGSVFPLPKKSYFQDPYGHVHIFRTEKSESEDSWVPSVSLYEGRTTRVKWKSETCKILDHHYKHAVLLAWGSDELKRRLSDFEGAGEDDLLLYDLGIDTFRTLLSPSYSSAKYF